MDAIYSNSSNINLLNNNSKDITLVNNKSIINENLNKNKASKSITKTDSIEISEKDANIINKKKAREALNDTCSEYSAKEDSQHYSELDYFIICDMMKQHGIEVPSFALNGDESDTTEFLPFIDKMKEFIKTNDIKHNGAPMNKTEFLDFCDLYKEKLVKYGCK